MLGAQINESMESLDEFTKRAKDGGSDDIWVQYNGNFMKSVRYNIVITSKSACIAQAVLLQENSNIS